MTYLVIRRAYEAGRWMWLIVGGPLDGQWVDSPGWRFSPTWERVQEEMHPIRPATEAELDEARRAMWPGASLVHAPEPTTVH